MMLRMRRRQRLVSAVGLVVLVTLLVAYTEHAFAHPPDDLCAADPTGCRSGIPRRDAPKPPAGEPVDIMHPASSAPNTASAPANERSTFDTAVLYLRLGYTHILPLGLDHILFVLALFLASASLRPLLIQITSFTVAHTITLALATLGIVQAPPSVIEPLIALSIALVAIENLFFSEITRWRPFIVFGFGLCHGLGFASALTALGLPRSQFFPALISFNVGVEVGQLSVVALAFVPAYLLRRLLKAEGRERLYRPIAVIPLSLLIGAIGAVWAYQRAFSGS